MRLQQVFFSARSKYAPDCEFYTRVKTRQALEAAGLQRGEQARKASRFDQLAAVPVEGRAEAAGAPAPPADRVRQKRRTLGE